MTQLDTIARLALTHAIMESYHDDIQSEELKQQVKAVVSATETALAGFPDCTSSEIRRIYRKIDWIENNTSIGKPRSIMTFIESCIALLDEPARKSRNGRRVAITGVVAALLTLRQEISGDKEFILSQIAAATIADVWDEVEI